MGIHKVAASVGVGVGTVQRVQATLFPCGQRQRDRVSRPHIAARNHNGHDATGCRSHPAVRSRRKRSDGNSSQELRYPCSRYVLVYPG